MNANSHTTPVFDPDDLSKRVPINWDEPLVFVNVIYLEAYPVVYHDKSCLGGDIHLIVYKKNGASAPYISCSDGTSATTVSSQRVFNVSSIPKVMLVG